MGYSVGPAMQQAQGKPVGMAPQGFMMGASRPLLDPDDFDTEKEYLAALKMQKMEDQEFFGSGMAPPNARWLGNSGYAPERWVPPNERVTTRPRWNQNLPKGPSDRPARGRRIY